MRWRPASSAERISAGGEDSRPAGRNTVILAANSCPEAVCIGNCRLVHDLLSLSYPFLRKPVMKVNPSQDTAASLLGSAISRDKLQLDFQASLDAAKKEHSPPSGKAPDADAMESAMSDALKEIKEYLEKGPVAYMRDQILKQMGLSEEALAQMPPEQRDAIEKTIAERIKEKLLSDSGIDAKSLQARLTTGLSLQEVIAKAQATD
jgi:hypothetical protein